MDNKTNISDADASAGGDFDFKLYRYEPSLPAAIVAIVVFALLTLCHVWRLYRNQAIYFTAFAVGGLFQTLGYCGRIWSHYDTDSIGGFVMQAILILVAPALYAASIYMILGRLIRVLHAEPLCFIPVRWLTSIFVTGDIISFTLQGGGGGIQAGGTLDLFDLGEKVIIVGLFLQIAFFGFFIVSALVFHRRLAATPTRAATQGNVQWRRHLIVLYTTSIIILVRSIFRVIEFLQGNSGYLISHEIFLFIFDALLMAMVMALFLVFYVDDLVLKDPRTSKRSPPESLDLMESDHV